MTLEHERLKAENARLRELLKEALNRWAANIMCDDEYTGHEEVRILEIRKEEGIE